MTLNYENDFSNFLKHLKDYPILSKEKEQELGKKINQAKKKNATKAEKEAGKQASNLLILHNLRLVVSIAANNRYPKVPLEDAVQEGILGLQRASVLYDYTKGFKFSTYATYWIKQAITRGSEKFGRVIRVPEHMIEKLGKYNQLYEELYEKYERKPTDKEIAKASDGKLNLRDIYYVKHNTNDPTSLMINADDNEEDNSNLLDFAVLEQPADTYEDKVEEKEEAEFLQKLLDVLTPNEKVVIIMHYGLNGEKEMSIKDIAKSYGFTIEKTRYIHNRAKDKMRQEGYKIKRKNDYLRKKALGKL